MENMTLHIRTVDKDVETYIPNPTEEHKSKLINNVFQLFGVATVSVSEKTEPKEVKPTTKPSVAKAVVDTLRHQRNDTTVHGNPTTMEEALGEPTEVPDFYKTGIKVRDGVKHYKCRYRCVKCNSTGNHYIPEGVEQVDCYECQTSLMVKKATPGTVGLDRDKFGNWFVAGSQLPVEEFIYTHTK